MRLDRSIGRSTALIVIDQQPAHALVHYQELNHTALSLLDIPYPDPLMAGGYGAGDPPDPIPNSEVKTRCADGTAGATRWESTAPPAFFMTNARPEHSCSGRAFGVCAGLVTADRTEVTGRGGVLLLKLGRG